MTLLHNLVAVAEASAEDIHAYLVSGDTNMLQRLVERHEAFIRDVGVEMLNPYLQPTAIRLVSQTGDQLNQTLQANNAAILQPNDYVTIGGDHHLVADKLIRIFAADQPENSAFVARVTLIQEDNGIVIAPVTLP